MTNIVQLDNTRDSFKIYSIYFQIYVPISYRYYLFFILLSFTYIPVSIYGGEIKADLIKDKVSKASSSNEDEQVSSNLTSTIHLCLALLLISSRHWENFLDRDFGLFDGERFKVDMRIGRCKTYIFVSVYKVNINCIMLICKLNTYEVYC